MEMKIQRTVIPLVTKSLLFL